MSRERIFDGKKIVITGASRGLGAACALMLAKKGATLALLARNASDLERVRAECQISGGHAKHLVVSVDFNKPGEIERASDTFLKDWKQIDGVLHVAGGGLGHRDPLLNFEQFSQLFWVNLGAVAELNRQVAPIMKSQGFGNLVHVGSVASYEAVGSVGYNSVKAGLAAYVRSLGRELAPFQVIANGINPGGFYAPGNAMDRLATHQPKAYQEFLDSRLPRKKMGTVEELFPVIQFLLSSQAGMASGCMFPMDGGEGRAY